MNALGYNVIVESSRVDNDMVQMLNVEELKLKKFDKQSLSALDETKPLAFNLNLDAIVPSETAKTLESLKEIDEEYDFAWKQEWHDKLREYEESISNIETDIKDAEKEVKSYQREIDAHPEKEDIDKNLKNYTQAEVSNIQKEINSLNSTNNNAIKKVPGREAKHNIIKEFNIGKNIVKKLSSAQKTINENPDKIKNTEAKLTNKEDDIEQLFRKVEGYCQIEKYKIEEQIEVYKNQIATLEENLKTATKNQSIYQEQLDDFYKKHSDRSNKNSLQQKLQKIVNTSIQQLDKLKNSNNLTKVQEKEIAFHKQNIIETKNLIAEIYNTGNLKQSLKIVFNKANNNFNTLKEKAEDRNRPDNLDENDFPKYTSNEVISNPVVSV